MKVKTLIKELQWIVKMYPEAAKKYFKLRGERRPKGELVIALYSYQHDRKEVRRDLSSNSTGIQDGRSTCLRMLNTEERTVRREDFSCTKNKKIWRINFYALTFAPVLLIHLSRKAEGHGPVKP